MQDEFLECFENARVSIANNEYDDAYQSLKKSLDVYTNKPDEAKRAVLEDVLNLAGQIALMNKDLVVAKSYFEQELNLNPASSGACYGLGEVFFALEEYSSAKTMLEWSVKNAPENQYALEALGKVNLLLGNEAQHNSLNS